jgi:hypothetical protein
MYYVVVLKERGVKYKLCLELDLWFMVGYVDYIL